MRNEDSGEMGMVYIDCFSYLDFIRRDFPSYQSSQSSRECEYDKCQSLRPFQPIPHVLVDNWLRSGGKSSLVGLAQRSRQHRSTDSLFLSTYSLVKRRISDSSTRTMLMPAVASTNKSI